MFTDLPVDYSRTSQATLSPIRSSDATRITIYTVSSTHILWVVEDEVVPEPAVSILCHSQFDYRIATLRYAYFAHGAIGFSASSMIRLHISNGQEQLHDVALEHLSTSDDIDKLLLTSSDNLSRPNVGDSATEVSRIVREAYTYFYMACISRRKSEPKEYLSSIPSTRSADIASELTFRYMSDLQLNPFDCFFETNPSLLQVLIPGLPTRGYISSARRRS